jgi:TolA-binding protein
MTHAQVDGGGNYNDSFTSTGSGTSGNNDPIRGVLWTTHRHGGRDASLSMVSVQHEPNWMLDGAGSGFDEDSEWPMPGAPPPPPPTSNKDEKGNAPQPLLSSLFSSTTLSRTRRAPRRTVSGDSALSLESFESFYSYGSNDRNDSVPQQQQQQQVVERPLPFTVTATLTSKASSKEVAAPSETGSPSGRRGGKRRDYQLRVISSQGSTLVTNRGNSENENEPVDNGGEAPSSGGKEGVDNDGAPMLRRIFRTFSWDGYDPNNLRGGGANAAASKPSDSSDAATSPLTNASTGDDRERLLAEIQLLRTQLEERQSLLDKFEKNPVLVGTLEQQVRSAAEEHVQLTDLVKELQKQIQAKDQELTAMRLESLSRGGFGSATPDGDSADTSNGTHVPSADSIGLCTSSRWDSPEVRGCRERRRVQGPSDCQRHGHDAGRRTGAPARAGAGRRGRLARAAESDHRASPDVDSRVGRAESSERCLTGQGGVAGTAAPAAHRGRQDGVRVGIIAERQRSPADAILETRTAVAAVTRQGKLSHRTGSIDQRVVSGITGRVVVPGVQPSSAVADVDRCAGVPCRRARPRITHCCVVCRGRGRHGGERGGPNEHW